MRVRAGSFLRELELGAFGEECNSENDTWRTESGEWCVIGSTCTIELDLSGRRGSMLILFTLGVISIVGRFSTS